jgi:hypothetical protein
MVNRVAHQKLLDLAAMFKVVAVTGPRQSGKTSLVKSTFPQKKYVSLENPDTMSFAQSDPRAFLDMYRNGAIFDEIQRVPQLFSFLQEIIDNSTQKGLFILSGSNNFLLQQNISQTLAGRISYLNLLPFTFLETKDYKTSNISDEALMLKGFYPPIYDQKINSLDWSRNYIRTYVERDVRQIKNISNLSSFQRFIQLLAARTGQELNASELGTSVGLDVKTVQSWIGILESSYIVFLLKPHFHNFNKTIVKRPKIYFYDTALICSLLAIKNEEQLSTHYAKGAIFETMIVSELIKNRANRGENINLYYWRDKTGHEIDVIVDDNQNLLPIEIKSGKTITSDYFKNMRYWLGLSKEKKGVLLYAGNEIQLRSDGIEVNNWREIIHKI